MTPPGESAAPAPAEAHILLVDDDERIRALLRRFLARQGFLVTVARDAAQARRLLGGLAFDLIVLDVMMPGEDGLALMQSLREQGLGVPALLLTAKGETDDRIAGLEAGADDYLAKPFEPRELLLRISAILRRAPPPAESPAGPAMIAMGPVRYDPERGEMWQGATLLRLTATETALMRLLAASPGVPVSRERLVERLGRAREASGGAQAQERAVDVQITRLRRKIERDPRQPRYLQTVRGEGYMLVSD
ncbi:DNA-binding response regulator [Rhodobacteraceae bacterium WD3A24]|nr:DNA-binding response regulator [Rhodobacteraceae bacterium WD3A24]